MSYENYGRNAPYYDDFDANNNFLRVMFNPSRAVQARELTQIQTMLQNQVGRLASHIFKENTSVFQAKISISDKKPTLKIKQFALLYNALEPNVENRWAEDGVTVHSLTSSWVGKTFQNTDPNDVSKTPTKTITITGYRVDPGENPVLYYEYSGADALLNERFYDTGNNGTSVGGITVAIEPYRSLVASVDAGVIWARGHFVAVVPQQLVISDTPKVGEYQIGFEIKEDIVTSADPILGATLHDPANGSFNFNAPGADRYRITAKLSAYKTSEADLLSPGFVASFVSFAIVRDGVLINDNHVTEYADILDLLARRTHDESGSYSVRDFSLGLKEANASLQPRPGQSTINLNEYVGYIPGFNDINDYLVALMGPGKAYVLGYEVDKTQTTPVLIYKGRNVQSVNNKLVNLRPTFSFVAARTASEISRPEGAGYGAGDWINFHRMEEVEVMSGLAGSGRVLTKARIAGVDRRGDRFRVHLMDTNEPNAAVGATGSTGVATTGVQSNLVNPINFKNIKAARSIRRVGDSGVSLNLAVDALNPKDIKPVMDGYPVPPIYKIPGIRTLSDMNTVADMSVVTAYSFTLDGAKAATVVSSNTSVVFEDQQEDVVVYAYNRTTDTVLPPALVTATPSGNSITLSFASIAGTSAGDQITVSLKERHPESNSRTKTKQTKTITVSIDSPSKNVVILPDEDVIGIQEIRQTNNIAAGLAGSNGKYKFSQSDLLRLRFDNGQRDFFYDKGSLTGWSQLFNSYKDAIKSGGNYVATTYEIVYEYYEHEVSSNKFFFSLKSYTDITDENDYVKFPVYRSSKYGDFDLMNALDFRRKISEMDNVSVAIPFPVSYDEVEIDSITHYVGRYVNIWVDKDARFGVTNGVASVTPEKPANTPGVMNLYTLYVPPYTFNKNDVSVQASKNLRYTMQDIRKLEDRIARLEDYVSLSLLEQNAFDLEVTDPVTGLSRFKSGIFVDPFRDHRFGDSKNKDYRVTIHGQENAIHCPVELFSFEMEVVPAASTAAIHKELITLPITGTKVLKENLKANSTINLNPNVYYVWKGSLVLQPAMDTWYDTRYNPETQVTIDVYEPPVTFVPVPRVDEVEQVWCGVPPVPPEIPVIAPPVPPVVVVQEPVVIPPPPPEVVPIREPEINLPLPVSLPADPPPPAPIPDPIVIIEPPQQPPVPPPPAPTEPEPYSGGGGCVHVESWMDDARQAKDIQIGDWITAAAYEPVRRELRQVRKNTVMPQPCYRMTTVSGITIIASDSTPMTMQDGSARYFNPEDMMGEMVLVDDRGDLRWEAVADMEYVGELDVVLFNVDDQCYFAGEVGDRRIATHNGIARYHKL